MSKDDFYAIIALRERRNGSVDGRDANIRIVYSSHACIKIEIHYSLLRYGLAKRCRNRSGSLACQLSMRLVEASYGRYIVPIATKTQIHPDELSLV
jgi:hypothetical protein